MRQVEETDRKSRQDRFEGTVGDHIFVFLLLNESAQVCLLTQADISCLFKVGSDGWALVSETGVDSRYCGGRLSDWDPEGGYRLEFPMPEENDGNGTVEPAFAVPGATPWRTITVGSTLKVFTGTATGTFAQIIPATPGEGLRWDTSELYSKGTLRVADDANAIQTASHASAMSTVYYTLSGHRVGHPRSGCLYLMRTTDAQGNTTQRKVLFR